MAIEKQDGNFIQRDETVLKGAKRTEFDFEPFDHSHLPVTEKVPVIIIGSSMVGMSLGVFLGYYGIPSINFDRHPSTATHPRAALFLLRTVEIFRQLGLATRLQEESAKSFDLDAGMIIVESLVGGQVTHRMQEADPVKTARVTPAKRFWLTQNMFEPMLRQEAKKFGAQQVFGTNVVHYETHKDGVTVVTKDIMTGEHQKYEAAYLVACDGNRSPVRRNEGIDWHGPGISGNSISINFRADLRPYLGNRAVHGVTYVVNEKFVGGFRLEDDGQAGFMIVSRTPTRSEFEPDSVTEEEAKQMFYMASGLDHEIDLTVDSIAYWSVAAFNAERYSCDGGRVFLAGDAAHVMPPTGGMGGNTGIQDAWNIAWKLAYVLKGQASPSLLRTYSEERQSAVEQIVQQAYSRLVNRTFKDKSVPHQQELPDDTCELGYRYTTGALVASDVKGFTERFEDPHHPSALPGSRMPHVWLVDSSNNDSVLSTLDLLGQNFIMISVDQSSAWVAAAAQQDIQVGTHVLSEKSHPLRDTENRVGNVYALDGGNAVLIRPDGHIAWRSDLEPASAISDAVNVLRSAIKKILGL